MPIVRMSVVMGIALALPGAAAAQYPVSPAALQPVQSSVAVRSNSLSMPAEVRGYHLTDSIQVSAGTRSAIQYVYKHENNVATVYVMQYVGEPPRTPDEATAIAQSDQERIRDSYNRMAQNGEIIGYRVTRDRADVIHLNGLAISPMCATMPPATDTINYGVYAALDAPARKDPLPSGYVDLVLDALRHGLIVPNPLGLTAYTAMSAGGTTVMVPAVYGEVEFTLDKQGKMSDAHLTQSSLSPALDQAIYDAPRRADSLQAFPAQVGVTNPEPIRFYVAISPVESHVGRSMQLFAVRMPAWRPGSRPGIDPAHDVKPVFPVVAREAGVGDSVTIQFVVDERGALVQRTMRLVNAGHIEYAQAVMEAAIGSQYIPAMAAGCPVKGLLERTWQMSVNR